MSAAPADAMAGVAFLFLAHLLLTALMPILMVGLVNRTKSWWAGRKGPGLFQSAWDLLRLLRKRPVYSEISTAMFRSGAWVVLLAALLASLIAPIFGAWAPLQFDQDFVVFAYTIGLARIVMMLSAMDVGSAFEGMGAAREAAFSAFAEPALFLILGAAGMATGASSFAAMMGLWHQTGAFAWLAIPALLVLFVLLQVEASRVPVDDPLTHLELTMIHEVMILDHSGPGLAAMQYAGAMKMSLYAGLIAALLNPFNPLQQTLACIAFSVAVMLVVAIAVGCIESLFARLRMRYVSRYLMLASGTALLCLLAVGLTGKP